jgi:thymidylate kinase
MAPNGTHALATRPFLITFSGIDGAGKTTQIEYVSSLLQERGLRVLRLSFWDDIAVWSNLRAGVGNWTADSSSTAPAAERSFSPRNNKHVRKWYLTAARSAFYMLDVAKLRRLLASERIRSFDAVIFDRYIYDQIANFQSQSFARLYGKLLLKQTPAPNLAFVLDASPAAAFARKPEYPLEFVYRNRRNFMRLREWAPELIVIPEATPEGVSSEIYFHISQSLLAPGIQSAGKLDVA